MYTMYAIRRSGHSLVSSSPSCLPVNNTPPLKDTHTSESVVVVCLSVCAVPVLTAGHAFTGSTCIGDAGATSFAAALSVNSSLRELTLRCKCVCVYSFVGVFACKYAFLSLSPILSPPLSP